MKRLNDESFINMSKTERNFTPDDVIAIRVIDGEFYFVGWMEDADSYAIQIAADPMKCKLERGAVIGCGDILGAIEGCGCYNRLSFDWLMDEKGNVLCDKDTFFKNEYECFLSYVRAYERNGFGISNDHDIFILSSEELASFIDTLRDGDYVFILKDETSDEELKKAFINASELYNDEQDFYQHLLQKGIMVTDVQRVMGEETAAHMLAYCIDHGMINETAVGADIYDRICLALKANAENCTFFWTDDNEIRCNTKAQAEVIANLFCDLRSGYGNVHVSCDEEGNNSWSVYLD